MVKGVEVEVDYADSGAHTVRREGRVRQCCGAMCPQ